MLADTRHLPTSVPDPGPAGVGAPIGPVGAWREGVAPPLPRSRAAARVWAGVVAVVAALGVWLTWRFFVMTLPGQRIDDMAWVGAAHGQGRLWSVAEPVLDVVSVAFVVTGMVAAVAMAVFRRRWFLALQVVVLVGGANVTTQLLKKVVLDRPDMLEGWQGAANTLPSGHTTVAASVSAAIMIAAPRGWRPVVALLGAAYTAATGVSTLVGQWHRPSDVVAALLVVLAWGALVCAFTRGTALDEPRRPAESLASPGSTVLSCLLLLGGVLGALVSLATVLGVVGSGWSVPLAPDLTTYAAGALAVLASTAVTFAVLLLVRQATARPRDPLRVKA